MNSGAIFNVLGVVGLGVLVYEFVAGFRRIRRHPKPEIYMFDDASDAAATARNGEAAHRALHEIPSHPTR